MAVIEISELMATDLELRGMGKILRRVAVFLSLLPPRGRIPISEILGNTYQAPSFSDMFAQLPLVMICTSRLW